jgi:hypothetical protein
MVAASVARCLDLAEPQETKLISADHPLSLTKKRIDHDFLSRLLSPSTSDAFGYLIGTYNRASQEGIFPGADSDLHGYTDPMDSCIYFFTSGGKPYAEYIKQQAVAYCSLLLLQPATFSGAIAPRQDAGARLLLNLISEDPRQRPFVKTGFLPDLIAHLRQLNLPGFNATNVGGVPDKLPPCVRALFAADPSLTVPGDGGGVFTLLLKDVSKVSRCQPCAVSRASPHGALYFHLSHSCSQFDRTLLSHNMLLNMPLPCY